MLESLMTMKVVDKELLDRTSHMDEGNIRDLFTETVIDM